MTNVRNESGLRVCTARTASLITFCRTRPLKAWTGSLTGLLNGSRPPIQHPPSRKSRQGRVGHSRGRVGSEPWRVGAPHGQQAAAVILHVRGAFVVCDPSPNHQRGYDMPWEGEQSLLECKAMFNTTPAEWPHKRFGCVRFKGWIGSLGSGRWSEAFPVAVAFQGSLGGRWWMWQ